MFEPRGLQVRGIPLRKIDTSWCAANEFKVEAFPEVARRGRFGLDKMFADGRSGFSTRGEFGERMLDVVLGAYGNCDGGQGGNFILVLASDREATGAGRIVQLETIGDPPFFMYLSAYPANDRISTPSCFACDHIAAWRWDEESQRFVRVPEPEFG